MITKTKAIVLNSVKYSDNSSIVSLYTEKFGTITTMIRYGKTKKSRLKSNVLQPLFLLNIELDYKQNKEIQHCKEISSDVIFNEIPFDTTKSSIAMFLSEFLNRVLKEEIRNDELFEFLHNAINLLDSNQEGTSNFHVLFIYKLSKYLGISPIDNYSDYKPYFDISKSCFSDIYTEDKLSVNKEISRFMHTIANSNFATLTNITMNGKQRTQLLDVLILYYKYHIPEIGNIKSLDVLKEVFA